MPKIASWKLAATLGRCTIFGRFPVLSLGGGTPRVATALSRFVRARRALLMGLALPLFFFFTGCNAPGSISVPIERLQGRIDQRFPLRYPLAGVLELRLQAPRLQPLPETGRIRAVMAVQAGGPVLRRLYDGQLELEFALRYESADQTVRAHDLQVLALQIDGLPPQVSQLLASLGPRLAQQAMRGGGILYSLQPKDLAMADRLGVQPGRISVTADSVVIELVPKAR